MGEGPYKHQWRAYLFDQQSGLCHYCREPMSLTARRKNGSPARNFATFEHLKRREDGGKTNSENVVLVHRACNAKANTVAQRMRPDQLSWYDRLSIHTEPK
jgi:5-methylcytosine-specific restriction endonuclease McrA